MNCCDHNHEEKGRRGGRHLSHLWKMALCCGIPVLAVLLLSLPGWGGPGVRTFLAALVPFLCPVLMIGMMAGMFFRSKPAAPPSRQTTPVETDEKDPPHSV